ncbi:SDR family oxidoreductase [Rhodopirellula sp. JC740]|uniref:SDR family oxidoreductase n=1 Tax=Rhodopirellula halodulae TaxID=2894198 RepID=A0ABS8NEL4_9BACT|nr:SDR family oxidoreductase [Rhodopirellula sp. JC740]MCC9642000.1 SDR family oxidoreductase [Rhodopirellula sp. JC740]
MSTATSTRTNTNNQTADRVVLKDPRHAYARPPFDKQKAMPMPGSTDKMTPSPDHGEDSYQGSGKLKGLNALITGADSGIGRAIAICYAREGANVTINYLSEQNDAHQTAEIAKQSGVNVSVIGGDLREESFCNDLVAQSIDEHGGIDILVNNAAYQETADQIEEFSTDLFDRIFKTNVYAPFWLSKAVMKRLPPGGSIINTVSIQGYDPSPYLLPYASTKSAMLGMTKALAQMAMERGIRVNAVAPGPVWTPLIPGSMPAEKFQQFGDNTVFGRPAQPIELAPLFVWLASTDATYVTGEVFGCTGGRSPV